MGYIIIKSIIKVYSKSMVRIIFYLIFMNNDSSLLFFLITSFNPLSSLLLDLPILMPDRELQVELGS